MNSMDTNQIVSHGVGTCMGCGLEVVLRTVLNVLGEDTIIVIPPGCAALFSGFGRGSALAIPGVQGNLENTAAIASGIRAGLTKKGNAHTQVLAFAGDGATLDIGLQSLSGMIERGDRVIYICYDNEAYMNTGVQSSSSTPLGASTTTTPAGKATRRKDLLSIAMAHGIPYAATASISHLPDFKRKITAAAAIDGPSLIHVLTPCPTGWGFSSEKLFEVARAAVNSNAWALYEYSGGQLAVSAKPRKKMPLKAYFDLQKRFRTVPEETLETLSQEYEQQIQSVNGGQE